MEKQSRLRAVLAKDANAATLVECRNIITERAMDFLVGLVNIARLCVVLNMHCMKAINLVQVEQNNERRHKAVMGGLGQVQSGEAS